MPRYLVRSLGKFPVNRRRVLVLVGAGVGGAAAFACSSKSSPSRDRSGPGSSGSAGTMGSPRRGGTYGDYLDANPATFDPQRTPSLQTTQCASAVMSRLFRFKPVRDPVAENIYDVQNDLAVSGESPDATTWTVKLRPDARFQNVAPVSGHAVEAEDVRTTFDRALGPENPNRSAFGMIDPNGVETPAKDTIVFKLKYPYADFKYILANGQYSWIFPREVAAGSYDPTKQMIGSGPFLLDSYEPDVAVAFRRNPGWFESGKPYVDAVRCAILANSAQTQAQFAGGHLHAIGRISQNDLDTLKKSNSTAAVIKSWAGGGPIVFFQMGDPASPFQDVRVREAVSLAIDREAIGKTIWGGQYQASFAVELTAGNWALKMSDLDSSATQWYKYDLTRAHQLITEAGLANAQFKLEYPAPYSALSPTYAQALYSMLARLPWQLALTTIDFNKDYIGGGKGVRFGNYPSHTLIAASLQASTTADDYLYKYFDSAVASSQTRVHDPTIDAEIAKARAIVDDNQRQKAVLDIQKYIAGKLYALSGLPQGYQYTLVSPNVQNFSTGDAYSVGTVTWAQVWLNQ